MPPDPFEVLNSLTRAGVEFVIIGGHAVNFHGYIRTTEDIDIIFLRTKTSEAALLKTLESIRACWISNEKDPKTGLERLIPVTDSYLRSQHLMMLWTDLGFLDIYDFIPGYPETPVQELFADAVILRELRFVSLAWLRRLKTAAGRHKDLDDLEHLPES